MAEVTIAIKDKLKALLPQRFAHYAPVVDTFAFQKASLQTDQLRNLARSTAQPLQAAHRGGEGTAVSACDIQHEECTSFLGVYGLFECLYIRHGYDELYDAIRKMWRIPASKWVVLLGNEGTGKSWYQIYVLRRLLRRTTDYSNDLDEYDFVFREVGSQNNKGSPQMYLMDIKAQQVYEVTSHNKDLMQYLTRCLYFFEPGSDKNRSPSSIYLPSLSTLSPNKDRIKEYMKACARKLYFWPWLLTELVALCEHTGVLGKLAAQQQQGKLAAQRKEGTSKAAEAASAQQQQKDAPMADADEAKQEAAKVTAAHDGDEEMVDAGEDSKQVATRQEEEDHEFMDELFQRYQWFGGIVRHIVSSNKEKVKRELDNCVQGLELQVLQSKAADIDEDVGGYNVSSFILCYDGKQAAMDDRSQGGIGFDKCILGHTSAFVEEEVEKVLNTKRLPEKMEFVRDRLNDHYIVDFSGKNLEAVATEFLGAADVKWEVKRAGSIADWSSFATTKRERLCDYDIYGSLTKQAKILVPSNTSFPVGDMAFSDWGQGPVYVFQCTWQETHPFTVRALYELRWEKLMVPHDQKVHVLFIVPRQEDLYADRPEGTFLNGSVDAPLEYSKREQPWLTIIGDWLSLNMRQSS